jgi:hypothetical protein
VIVRRVCPSLILVAAGTLAGAPLSAIERNIGSETIERAIALGGRDAAERERTHLRYVVDVSHSLVRSFEVITEYRRVVLAKEHQFQIGNRFYGMREAEEMLKPWRGRVSVVAHVRFSPQNALVSVPQYEMRIEGARDGRRILPFEVRRNPLYSNTRLLSADIEGIFDASPLDRTRGTVILEHPPGQVSAATIDFAALE